MLMQGDLVRYVGKGNFSSAKNSVKHGEVLAPMGNEPGVYVVEFGDDAYVLSEAVLTKYVPSVQDLEAAAKEPEVVQKKRRRRDADEE